MSWSFSSSSPFTLTLAASLFAAPVAAPQANEGARPGKHGALPAKPGAGPAQEPVEPGEEPLAPGAIKVRAESYEQTSKGHVEARGLVDLRVAGARIQADKADVLEDKQPDGSTKQRIVADGNVVFIRGEERLSGDHLEMDDSGKGVLLNAVGYLEPGVFVKARKIERVDEDSYRIEGGTFSSCSQPNPRWNFSASRARVEVDDKITGTNAVFKVKGVPAFYMPYIYYPISKDHRSTGFLIPSIGWTSVRGYNVNAGFFWAMGRSADQTFSFDYYSKSGYGVGHELRWLGPSSSRWMLKSVVFNLKSTSPDATETSAYDYNINWNVLQMLPGKVRATASVASSSNLRFLQQYQENYATASNRSDRWSAALERDFGFAVLNAYGDTASTLYGTGTKQVSGRVPGLSLRRFPRQIGWGGFVFGLEGSAERIRYGTDTKVDTWTRYDLAPTLSRPLHISFLDFNPSVGYRYTRYGSSVLVDANGNPQYDENGELVRTGPPLDRSFFETSVYMGGPTFARVFDTPGFGYGERFKHTIGPEVTWTYRTRVDDYGAIPKSDGQDYSLGTNEINYALAQRFFTKRRSATGKPVPYEFLSWRLMQTYYVQIKEGQKGVDLNYASSAPGPGNTSEHLGPIQSRIRLRPGPDYSLDYTLNYDVNFQQIRRMLASANVARPGFMLQASWSRSYKISDDPTKRGIGGETLSGSTSFDILPRRLMVEGSANYDLLNKNLYQMHAQVRYSVQCCGFLVAFNRLNWTTTPDTQWRFSIELANVGSFGTSTGADLSGGRSGLGGYR